MRVEILEGEAPKVFVNNNEVPVIYLNYRYVTDSDRRGVNQVVGKIIRDEEIFHFQKDMRTGVVVSFKDEEE